MVYSVGIRVNGCNYIESGSSDSEYESELSSESINNCQSLSLNSDKFEEEGWMKVSFMGFWEVKNGLIEIRLCKRVWICGWIEIEW